MAKAIGALEFSSIGLAFQAQDALLKTADVDLLLARTVCSGKYLIVIGGPISDIESAIAAALQVGAEALIDHEIIPAVDDSVFEALGQSVVLEPGQVDALGVIETFSGVSVIAAADAAAKAANVQIFRIHVAMAIGGKGFLMLTGSAPDVQAAIAAGARQARSRGLLVSEVVIQGARPELFTEYI